MKILIKDIPYLLGNPDNPVLEDVHLGIDGEKIAFILPVSGEDTSQRIEAFAAEHTICGKKKLVMPGLINTHSHVGMNLLRNYGSDLNLQDWLHTKVFPSEANLTPEDIHWASLQEMAEMILCGTTGFVDMYFFSDKTAQNVIDSGLRAKICSGIVDIQFTAAGKTYKTLFDKYLEFQKHWQDREGRLKVMALVHSTYLPPYAALVEMADFVKEHKLAVHTHMHETAFEVTESLKEYGKRPIAIAHELGFFTPSTVVAHCVHLNDDDRRMLAMGGVHVSHCPSSNLKLASGIADLQAMLDAGINVSIGTDGASSNNNINMFEELHLAAILQKGAKGDPLLQPATQMFHLVTQNGAKALEMEEALGLIKEGAPADMILLDIDVPHLVPLHDPIAAVVYSAQGSDVDTVIVKGQILMEKRLLKTIDIEAAKWQTAKIAKRIVS
jgi:5-methylthioadenosine/S-adenosylhomocysteine deaminase